MKTHTMRCYLSGSKGSIMFVWVALSILATAGLLAQSSSSPDQKPAESQQAPPQGIPLAQVSLQAQEVRGIIDELKALSAPDPQLDTISTGLGALGDSLATPGAQRNFQNLERLPTRTLTDVYSRWRTALGRVDEWENRLLEKSDELSGAIAQLRQLAEIWTATRDTARTLRAPRALKLQVEATLSAITDARKGLEGRFREVLALQEAVTSRSLPLIEGIKRIEARRAELARQVFVVDAPPLWEALAEEGDTTGVVASVHQSWVETIGATMRYLRRNSSRATFHLVISALCFGLFLLLRYHVGKMASEEPLPKPLPDAVSLLRRPLAATLLVLVFLVRYFYPDAPVGLTDFFKVVVILPFLILALSLFKPAMRPILVAILVLYALGLTRQLIAEDAGAARVVLLVESTLGVGLFLFGLRPGGVLRSPDVLPKAKLVRRLATLALVSMIAALVANVGGSVSLASRITTGVTMSAATAIFYGILVLLADGVLFFTVKSWLTKVSRLAARYSDIIVRVGMRIIALAGIVVWVFAVFAAFDLRTLLVDWLGETLGAEWGIGTVQVSLGAILLFAAVLIGSFVVARLARLTLEEEIFSRVRLPRGVPGAVSMVARYTVVGLGIVLALASLGLDLGKFGLLAGALGVGLGFGLQNIVANFVSGIILAFERPIQVGDMVQLGSLWGTITSIGVRSTRVRAFDGSEVVIPNNDLISKEVTNWTLSDNLRRMAFPVKVEFGSEPGQVIDVMLEAVRQHQVPRTDPAPFVIFEGLGEYFLNFTLYFWITTDKYLVGKNEVGMAVLDALKKAGIQIPSAPHRITIEDRRSSGNAPG